MGNWVVKEGKVTAGHGDAGRDLVPVICIFSVNVMEGWDADVCGDGLFVAAVAAADIVVSVCVVWSHIICVGWMG